MYYNLWNLKMNWLFLQPSCTSMKMNISTIKPDSIGALASSLCLIHCLATPFLFVAKTCTDTCCDSSPAWWFFVDYMFLIISCWAVYQSTQNTSKKFMKPLLWGLWSLLFFAIVNEKLLWVVMSKNVTYTIAISLALVHLYSLRYCQCKTNKCCTNNE